MDVVGVCLSVAKPGISFKSEEGGGGSTVRKGKLLNKNYLIYLLGTNLTDLS